MKKKKLIFHGQNMNTLLGSGCGLVVFADLVWVIILFSASDASTRCTKSTRICGRLVKDVNCRWCSGDCGLTRTTDGCPCNSIALGGQTLEVVDSFC